ncbi:MAG: 1,4-dihydroxy-6-naphthoate synthase [Bacteroidota bacterium]
MQLSLGFSPCPNDTFIFDAMIHQKVDTEGLTFEVVMEDVEALNQMAFKEELAITKLSYHAYAYLINAYQLLHSGSALGNNCGPLLIAKRPIAESEIAASRIAIPGRFTTANFLLGLAFPKAQQKEEVLFSDIEKKVLDESFDAGLIIHENRFTYAERGLVKLMDLGEFWEQQTQMPIPLGGIVAKRSLPLDIRLTVNRVLRRSIEYAFAHPEAAMPFVKEHAQEMEPEVMKQHIALYVNDYTLDLGENGRRAVEQMFQMAVDKQLIPPMEEMLFLPLESNA